MAEGATVVSDNADRNFYERVVLAPQPRSLGPDRLSKFPFAKTGPGTLALQTFTDGYTIGDGTRTIELYHVQGLNHASDMLVAYLPRERRSLLAAARRKSGERRENADSEATRSKAPCQKTMFRFLLFPKRATNGPIDASTTIQ